MTNLMSSKTCQCILQRYLGKFLERKLELDQLSIDLIQGHIEINDLSLNISAVNEILTNLNFPLKLVDGHIGTLSVDVPWAQIMGKPTKMKIGNLQLTFHPTESFKVFDKETINSMVESVVNSLVSSEELARSVLEEAAMNNEEINDDEGDSLGSFAKVINAIYSRFSVDLEDTIIRIEHQSSETINMCTAVELRCERARFMDEQMQICEEEGQPTELITSQPYGLGSITNLNKFLKLEGVSLYTDIFESISEFTLGSEANVLITSMHIRREKMKQQSPTKQSPQHSLNPDLYASSMSDMDAFHSCYQSLTQELENEPIESHHFETLKPPPTQPELFSNPVQVVDVVGEVVIVFRLKNAANAMATSEREENIIETEFSIKRVNAFVNPSQIAILKRVFSSFSAKSEAIVKENGKPMNEKDYVTIVKTMEEINSQGRQSTNNVAGNSLKGQNWQKPDVFFEFDNINSDDKRSKDNEQERFNSMKNNLVREEISVKASIGTLLLYISHFDHLSIDNVEEMGGYDQALRILKDDSEKFFQNAKKLSFSAQMKPSMIRSAGDKLYKNDHLRVIGSSIGLNYVTERNSNTEKMSAKLVMTNCDIFEFLTSESAPASETDVRIPLLDYTEIENVENDPNLKLAITSSSEVKGQMNYDFYIGGCQSEIDFSLVDRISDLVVTRPFFDGPVDKGETGKKKEIPQLKEELFTGNSENAKTVSVVTVKCAEWTVDLRIPKADLRDPNGSRLPYAQRHIHNEYVKVRFKDVEVTFPSDNEDITKIDIGCSEISGDFAGSSNVPEDQRRILYGVKSGLDRVKIRIETDPRKRRTPISRNSYACMPEDITKSFSAPVFQAQQKMEGPFSKIPRSFCNDDDENENIVQAGNRKEMLEFQEECLSFASIKLILNVPCLRLHIPENRYLEVLYNRLINDLALFQPAAPALRLNNEKVAVNAQEAFHECPAASSEKDANDSDVEEEKAPYRPIINKSDEFDRSIPHTFCTSLNVKKCTIVCNTILRENNLPKGVAQVVMELDKANIGATTGYHGNINHTYFHFTSSRASIGNSSGNNLDKNIPSRIESKDFGKWPRDNIQMEYVSNDDEFSNGSTEDAFAVALYSAFQYNEETEKYGKNNLLCISLRNSLYYAKPVKDLGHLWIAQLAELFTLKDYAIPGYELPQVTTDLHVTLENAIIGYNHNWINPKSDLQLRAVLGQCHLCSSLLSEMNVSKTLCIFEKACLYMGKANDSKKTVQYTDRIEDRKMFIPVVDIGLVQLDILITLESKEKKMTPIYEIKCRNDIIQMWMCADSLSSLITIGIELFESDKFAQSENEKKQSNCSNDGNDEMNSVAGESCWSEASASKDFRKLSVGKPLPEDIKRRLQEEIAEAMSQDVCATIGEDAVDEFRSAVNKKKNIDFFDLDMKKGGASFSGDDEFCMVDDDIIGSGITNVEGEARVRYTGKDREAQEETVNYDLNYFPQPDEWRSNGLPQLAQNHPMPIFKYLLKNFSFQIHLYAGNDLLSHPSPKKTYTTRKFKSACDQSQKISQGVEGGSFRDHSASVVFELSKIIYMKQVFDKNSPTLAITLFSIGDVVIKDKINISEINEMLYQYSCTDQPRRTHAPLLSIRISETQCHEGKMRVSMMPIKININQYTVEFLTDFVEEVSKSIKLPTEVHVSSYAQNCPTIEVPAEIRNGNSRKSSSNASKINNIYPVIDAPPLNMEPLKPSPAITPCPLGDLSYLERCTNVPQSPIKRLLFTSSIIDTESSMGGSFKTLTGNEEQQIDVPEANSPIGNLKDDLSGDWHDECNISFDEVNGSTNVDNMLSRSTMMGSFHPQLVADLVNTFDESEESEECFFNDSFNKNNFSDQLDQEPDSVDAADSRSIHYEEETDRKQTFYKEFVFSPSVNIYVDYEGKQNMSTEKTGALVGILMAFGQLDKMPITLKEINYKKGLLGSGRCFKHAIGEWSDDMILNIPGAIASCGPLSSFWQIGRGIYDLFYMPMEEMRKNDGHVVKGIQKGVGSFSKSSAAGLIGMAQSLTGFAQGLVERAHNEVRPNDPHLNRRNRQVTRSQAVNPTDVKHSLQLVYGIIYDGYQQTKDDLELAVQEDRASGNSVVRSAFRYAVPTFLGPIVIATRVTYQLLGGIRNQLRPDAYNDERRKWGEENVPGGVGNK